MGQNGARTAVSARNLVLAQNRADTAVRAPFCPIVESAIFGSSPGQHSLAPSPSQALNQQEQEDHHRDKRAGSKTAEGNRKGQQKNGFHIENEKNDGI